MLALHIFIIGVLLLSATVRAWCLFESVGMFLALVGHDTPHTGAAFYEYLSKSHDVNKNDTRSLWFFTSPVGQCFPHTRAV